MAITPSAPMIKRGRQANHIAVGWLYLVWVGQYIEFDWCIQQEIYSVFAIKKGCPWQPFYFSCSSVMIFAHLTLIFGLRDILFFLDGAGFGPGFCD